MHGAETHAATAGCCRCSRVQVEKLKEHARPVKGSSEIRSVASISAGNDEAIGQMIADALEKVWSTALLRRLSVVGKVSEASALLTSFSLALLLLPIPTLSPLVSLHAAASPPPRRSAPTACWPSRPATR